MDILRKYEHHSGQRVNLEKSAAFFSKNTSAELRSNICKELEGIVEQRSSKYLGLPMVIGRSKKQMFSFIKDRMFEKVKNWKTQFLSTAGKETMLKAVAMALPVYCMACFKLPKGLCEEMVSAMSNFWWGQKEKKHKVHWVAWNRMTDTKERGGLGFKDLQAFNDALLTKQLWRLITRPNSLMARVIKNRYFPKGDIFQAKINSQASWLWRSWVSARYLLKEGCVWRVGDGKQVRVWEDRWLQQNHIPKPVTPKPAGCEVNVVADLRNPEGKGWNQSLLEVLFSEKEVCLITSVHLSAFGVKDRIVWKLEPNEQYSVGTGYELAMQIKRHQRGGEEASTTAAHQQWFWKKLWGLNVKKKVIHFLWRCTNNSLPVGNNMFKRGMQVCPICCHCGENLETIEHVLFECEKARTIWKLAPVSWEGLEQHRSSFTTWWLELMKAGRNPSLEERIELSAYILWQTWKARNGRIFQQLELDPREIVSKAIAEWREFQQAQNLQNLKEVNECMRQKQESWSKPAAGWVRIKASSVTGRNKQRVALGITAMDETGIISHAWTATRGVTSPQ